jgi:hypothetical protein
VRCHSRCSPRRHADPFRRTGPPARPCRRYHATSTIRDVLIPVRPGHGSCTSTRQAPGGLVPLLACTPTSHGKTGGPDGTISLCEALSADNRLESGAGSSGPSRHQPLRSPNPGGSRPPQRQVADYPCERPGVRVEYEPSSRGWGPRHPTSYDALHQTIRCFGANLRKASARR